MKKGQVKAGDLVFMNKLKDATIYEVLCVDGFSVQLCEYGTNYAPHWIDVCAIERTFKK